MEARYLYDLTVNEVQNQFEAVDEFVADGQKFRILKQITQVKDVSYSGGTKIISFESCENPVYVYFNVYTKEVSRPFHFADKVYNDGFAPVITEKTEINGSGNPVTKRYIQYYNPSQDLLIETKFNTDYYALGEDADAVPKDAYFYHDYFYDDRRKVIVSKYINWPLLISKDPINFYFVPNEKLQSKNFVRACKKAAKSSNMYYLDLPSRQNANYSKAYHEIVDKYFSDGYDVSNDGQYIIPKCSYINIAREKLFHDSLNQLYADKLAAAKAELEAQGKQCGDR